MCHRGYTVEEVKAIIGGNALRVMRAVEAKAKELQQTQPPYEQVDFPPAPPCRLDF